MNESRDPGTSEGTFEPYSSRDPVPCDGNVGQLLCECKAMVAHALNIGKKIEPEVFRTVEKGLTSTERLDHETEEKLVKVHNDLAALIKPATPTSVAFLAREYSRPRTFGWLFPRSVSVARSMAIVGVASLIIFCVLLIVRKLGATPDYLYSVMRVVYPLVAASLGAAFLALYQANSYIVARTFDPKYIPSYYYRYVLGLMAGMMLANLVPGLGAQAGSGGTEAGRFAASLTEPVLAMLGGFSASVVYRILIRLADAVESIVRGDTKDLIDAKLAEERARQTEQAATEKIQLAGELRAIGELLKTPATVSDVSERIKKLTDSILPGSSG